MVIQSKTGETGDTPILGALLWYTITEMDVTREDLEAAFVAAGIEDDLLPGEISPRDAFRRATTTVERKHIPQANGTFVNRLVREVRTEETEIIRHLVREVVDAKNVRLDYKAVAMFSLAKGEGDHYWHSVELEKMTPEEQDACQTAERQFEKARECYNGRHVREIVTNILRTCHPVAVRPSGGVYFVARRHEDTVNRLKALIDRLAPCGTTSYKSKVWTVPVIDAADQREMVTESIEDQVQAESETIIRDLASALKSGRKILPCHARGYADRVRRLAALTVEYETLLETDLETAKSNLELAQAQAMAVLEVAEADKETAAA